MSDAKYTPGPWLVFEHTDHSGLCIGPPYNDAYLKGRVRDVCTISGGSRNGVKEQHRVNAKLISSAPEMLEALNEVIHEWGAGPSHLPVGERNRLLVKMCEAANKAEGR